MAQVLVTEPPKMFGAYIESISSSIGYGGQGGSCQMTIVEDKKNDVVANLPSVGTASYVKLGGFSFGGVFQRWTYKEAIDGRKYDIILESPAKLLDGVQVILSSFEGTAFNEGAGYDKFAPAGNPNATSYDYANIFNPFGYKENYSFGGRFGAANTNSAGFLARDLLDLLEELSRDEDSPFGGKIRFGESEYIISFGELKDVPEYFRMGGQSVSLSSIIAECADILQYDYFASIKIEDSLPDGGDVLAAPEIEIKTIEKTAQPDAGAVAKLVEEAKRSQIHISSEIGQEFSDETSNRMVVGGPASRYFLADIGRCYPIWGKTGPKKYVISSAPVPFAYQADYSISIPLDEISGAGGNSGSLLSGFYSTTPDELRMATAGFESWAAFKVFQSVAKGTYENDPWCASVDADLDTIQQIAQGRIGPISMSSTSLTSAQKMYNDGLKEYTQQLFQKVQNCANNFFGKMFMVPLLAEPGGISNNLKFIEEDIREENAWEYADSAWVSNKPVSDISFYDGSGRLKTSAIYEISNIYDYSELGTAYAGWRTGGFRQLFSDGIATTSCSAADNGDIFWIPGYGTPFIIMEIGAQVKAYDGGTTTDFGITYLAKKFFGVDIDPRYYLSAGKQNTQIQIPPAIAYPKIIGVPQTSTRYSWGPWVKSADPKGKSEVVFDTSLVPETFGGVGRMNQAGNDTAGAGVAIMDAKESGRVELAELPRFNIAERFNNGGPYITNMGMKVDTGGITTNYQFNTWTPNFGKLSKYNADRIARVYKSTIDALNRIDQSRLKIPLPSKAPPKKSGGGAGSDGKSKRQDPNRTSASFTFSNFFNGNKLEMNGINIADAAGMLLGNLFTSNGCSEDQKWSPVATRSQKGEDDSGIYFQMPVDIAQEPDGRFTDGVFPSSNDLDPYFSTLLNDDPEDSIRRTDFVATIGLNGDQPADDLQLRKANKKQTVDHVKSIGLRGPLMLSGFGIDIAGNPVPNDPDDISAIHEEASDRTNWVTGPVNLMWDKERKVWSGGLEIISGILVSDITSPATPLDPTTFTINVLRKNKDAKGSGSQSTSGEIVTCYNRDVTLSQEVNNNVFVIAVRLNYEWVPLWVSCP
jgi:hypothetical protein